MKLFVYVEECSKIINVDYIIYIKKYNPLDSSGMCENYLQVKLRYNTGYILVTEKDSPKAYSILSTLSANDIN